MSLALKTRRLATSVLLGLTLAGCGSFAAQADANFGDQHFKTAVSLIELYRLRHGTYPATLQQLDFVGDWDRIALSSVSYEKLPDGYALDLVRGWVGKPEVSYPPEFWKGLGIRRSNVGGLLTNAAAELGALCPRRSHWTRLARDGRRSCRNSLTIVAAVS